MIIVTFNEGYSCVAALYIGLSLKWSARQRVHPVIFSGKDPWIYICKQKNYLLQFCNVTWSNDLGVGFACG